MAVSPPLPPNTRGDQPHFLRDLPKSKSCLSSPNSRLSITISPSHMGYSPPGRCGELPRPLPAAPAARHTRGARQQLPWPGFKPPEQLCYFGPATGLFLESAERTPPVFSRNGSSRDDLAELQPLTRRSATLLSFGIVTQRPHPVPNHGVQQQGEEEEEEAEG